MKLGGLYNQQAPEKGDGVRCTSPHSPAMIKQAKKELLAFFANREVRKPGDLEDKFAGQWSLDLAFWRVTPHFPALGHLVNEGKIVFGTLPDGDVVYSLPGHLPVNAR